MTQALGRKPAIINDVAALAGVSVPTVSRVLTGAARVSESKRLRVLDAIDQLNYRPSAAARALVTRRPRQIAVLTGNTSRYGYATTIRGIEERARTSGLTVSIIVVESPEPAQVDAAVQLVLGHAFAGVIVLKFDDGGAAALKALPEDVPVVAVSGSRSPGIPHAVLEEADGAEQVVDYLLDLGHATVHHMRVPAPRREDRRTTGWRRALERRGAAVPPILEATWEPTSGRDLAAEVVRVGATAVFCGNDEIAMGLLRGLGDLGKRVPADVSVVGFDDHPLAALWPPSLTTVRQDFADLGARAFDLLAGRLEGRLVSGRSSSRLEVIVRESSGPPIAE